MRLLIYTAAWAVLFSSAFFYLIGRAADYEARTQDRIIQLERLACGFEQFEDYSVIVQPMDWAREQCVTEISK